MLAGQKVTDLSIDAGKVDACRRPSRSTTETIASDCTESAAVDPEDSVPKRLLMVVGMLPVSTKNRVPFAARHRHLARADRAGATSPDEELGNRGVARDVVIRIG